MEVPSDILAYWEKNKFNVEFGKLAFEFCASEVSREDKLIALRNVCLKAFPAGTDFTLHQDVVMKTIVQPNLQKKYNVVLKKDETEWRDYMKTLNEAEKAAASTLRKAAGKARWRLFKKLQTACYGFVEAVRNRCSFAAIIAIQFATWSSRCSTNPLL